MQTILLTAALLVTAARLGLTLLNMRQLSRPLPALPSALAAVVEPSTWQQAARYARERARFGLVSMLFTRMLGLWALFGGAVAAYDAWVSALFPSFVASGVAFYLGLAALVFTLTTPFSLYFTFVIEARYGFNRSSFGLWCADLLKGGVLSAALLAGGAALGLSLVELAPSLYWLLAWALAAALSVLLSIAWPHLIEPLFFKVTSLSDPALEPSIRELAERARVQVTRVFQVDASRRSSHSNAYFSGLGPEKRVVLFDTLLARLNHPEILAVLAHELGHYRKNHVLKRFVTSQLLSLAVCYAAFFGLEHGDVSSWVGASHGSFAFRVLVLAFAFSLAEFVATPLFSYWSRRDEREADAFARELTGDPGALASGLAKLARDNLSNLNPHPLHAAFYGSHPPTRERIMALSS
ncbi:MAG: M48 family metallopeptidase [Polyangiaceae bacterium]